jgi:hypothetical protein
LSTAYYHMMLLLSSPPMTPSEARAVIRRASKYRADAESVLEDLENLYQVAFQGYQEERNTARGDVVRLQTKDLETALGAKKAQWSVFMDLYKVAASESDDIPRDFIINILPLEEH